MDGDDVAVLAVVEERVLYPGEKGVRICNRPVLRVHPVVLMPDIAAGETGHLQQTRRPQFRIFRTEAEHRLGECQSVGQVEPAEIASVGLVEVLQVPEVEAHHIERIGPQQAVEKVERRRGAAPGGECHRPVGVQAVIVRRGGRRSVRFRSETLQGCGVAAELGDQVLAKRRRQTPHQREQDRFRDVLAQPADQRPGLGHIDGGVAETGIVGERGPGQPALHGAPGIAGRDRAAGQADGARFVFLLDRPAESLLVPCLDAFGIGVAPLAQGVFGHVADGLQKADEPVLGPVLMLVVKRQPVRHAGIGVRPAEFQPVMRPADRFLYGACGIDAEPGNPGDLARQPLIVMVAEALLQVVKRFRQPLPDGRIDDLDPDIAAPHLDRIDAQPVAVALVLARLQVELPVVPVAGEQAVAVERPFAQRIALMRAAVVAGADASHGIEKSDLAAIQPEDRPALAAKLLDADGLDPALVHRRASR